MQGKIGHNRISLRNTPASGTLRTLVAAFALAPCLLAPLASPASALPGEEKGGPGASAARVKPRLFVLSVGAGAFNDAKVQPVPMAVRDAADVSAALKAQAKSGMYRSVDARTLAGKDATRQAVRDGLHWLRGAVGSGDVAVVFVSGHQLVDANLKPYLLTADVRSGSEDDLKATALPMAEVQDAAAALPGKAMLLLDVNHGPAARKTESPLSGLNDILNGKSRFGNKNRIDRSFSRMTGLGGYKAAVAPGQVRTLYSASGEQVSAPDPSGKNSAFAAAFLEAVTVREAAGTGGAPRTADELIRIVKERVAEKTGNQQKPLVADNASAPQDFPVAVPVLWQPAPTTTAPPPASRPASKPGSGKKAGAGLKVGKN